MAYSAGHISIESTRQGNGEADNWASAEELSNLASGKPSIWGNVEHPGLLELDDGCHGRS
jgi:hypothetical protein